MAIIAWLWSKSTVNLPYSPLETNQNACQNRTSQKHKFHLPTINFQGLLLLASKRVIIIIITSLKLTARTLNMTVGIRWFPFVAKGLLSGAIWLLVSGFMYFNLNFTNKPEDCHINSRTFKNSTQMENPSNTSTLPFFQGGFSNRCHFSGWNMDIVLGVRWLSSRF